MLKQLWIWAVCLLAAPLSAEIIGDIEVQFPPSNYEWKRFFDLSNIDFYLDDEDDEEEDDSTLVTWYAHREGDALEIVACGQTRQEKDEEADEPETIEEAQRVLDAAFKPIFPNHRIVMTHFEGAFFAFELTDGSESLIHGLVRSWTDPSGERTAFLSYSTTAQKNERNQLTWTEVLNQARFVN